MPSSYFYNPLLQEVPSSIDELFDKGSAYFQDTELIDNLLGHKETHMDSETIDEFFSRIADLGSLFTDVESINAVDSADLDEYSEEEWIEFIDAETVDEFVDHISNLGPFFMDAKKITALGFPVLDEDSIVNTEEEEWDKEPAELSDASVARYHEVLELLTVDIREYIEHHERTTELRKTVHATTKVSKDTAQTVSSASLAPQNNSHLILTFRTSTPQISLSAPHDTSVLRLIVQAKHTGPRPITLCIVNSVLDNGHHARHDGLFRGAILPLTSTADTKRKIQLHFAGHANNGSLLDAPANLLEQNHLRFETVPAADEGALEITNDITLERLFGYSDLSLGDVAFVVRMNPRMLRSVDEGWWTWGSLDGELIGKKFARWERPDNHGEIGNLMPGEKMPNVQEMEREGWVFSELFDELKIAEGNGGEAVVEFVE